LFCALSGGQPLRALPNGWLDWLSFMQAIKKKITH
jgi:hypothetical protein